MRVCDDERERAVALLRARCVEGYLSMETFEYRLGRALTARSAIELRQLVVDLGSSNGTWLLGQRLGRARVLPGDELVLGDCPVALDEPALTTSQGT